jgi:hypothetical protein
MPFFIFSSGHNAYFIPFFSTFKACPAFPKAIHVRFFSSDFFKKKDKTLPPNPKKVIYSIRRVLKHRRESTLVQ